MSTITAESVVDAEAARPLRADARRNRERVLVAATAVFAEEGADASVAEIARRAGVGAGTLFRHFPTKHDLLLATLEQGFDDIQAAMERAEAMDDAWEGLVHVLTVCAEIQARDRSFLDSVGPELFREPSLQRRNQERMEHIRQLVARAQAAGLLRDDLRAEDVPFLLSAVGGATGQCTSGGEISPELWRRYLGIVLDGLRPVAATPLPVAAPTFEQLTAKCAAVQLADEA
ncbi:Transcriptional regulator TetR family [Patulibacter medicamentivorans]|uniref:Transcriptional regulator TetR family n=1 Tax=Patulibacter medicamentivorans TaxID=1097667 RepID=H0E431_9ACTN|nr:TetR/AcrR family transcriptional regulator [Patulibacter medicamentivorans]EHN11566.1 Transcriptional regulator TetR family [Patulibacter medicamentivorans]